MGCSGLCSLGGLCSLHACVRVVPEYNPCLYTAELLSAYSVSPGVVKRIYIVLDDETHERLKRIKERFRLKWDEALIRGLLCLEKHPEEAWAAES